MDNIYINVRINYIPSNNNKNNPIPAEYDVTKNEPYVKIPGNHYITVVSLSMPLKSIPITICEPENISLDIYKLKQIIAINYLGTDYSQNLLYVPNNDLDTYSPYFYYVYSYDQIIDQFNAALSLSHTASGAPGISPYFYIENGFVTLVCDDLFINSGATIKINNDCYIYLEGFQYNVNYSNILNRTFIFNQNGNVCNQYGGNQRISTGFHYWIQEYYSLQDWSIFKKIVIYSNGIPINTELSTVNNISTGYQLGDILKSPIIFDYTPQIDRLNNARTLTYYQSPNQYRLVDMNGDTPQYRINLSFYWQDIYGNYYKIFLKDSSETINVKLGIFNKKLYKHTN